MFEYSMVRYDKSVVFSDTTSKISQDPNSQSPKDTNIKMRNTEYSYGAKSLSLPNFRKYKKV